MKNTSKADFVNDADYPTQVGKGVDKWTCPFYKTWYSMKNRACKVYSGVSVCEEWLVFSNFKGWMESQPHYGRQLDKDILGDGTLYSPETCVFVPAWINTLVVTQASARGKWPIGVHFRPTYPKPYQAQVSNGLGGKVHLGYHATPELAHEAYKAGKSAVVLDAIEHWKTCGLLDADSATVDALIEKYVEVEKYE